MEFDHIHSHSCHFVLQGLLLSHPPLSGFKNNSSCLIHTTHILRGVGTSTGVWLEYWWNPLDVMVGTKLDIEDDDPYQLAIAIADYYRIYRWEEFCEFSKKNKTCCTK